MVYFIVYYYNTVVKQVYDRLCKLNSLSFDTWVTWMSKRSYAGSTLVRKSISQYLKLNVCVNSY